MSAMSIKAGTKNWSDGNTTAIQKPDGVNHLTKKDLEKLGGDNLGDVLNRMSDPNYVDPAKRIRAVGNDKMDKDAFMKLMLAQMKNQDPTNPLKSHEMAAQLAQFSSLEQLQNVNDNLSDLKTAQKPTETYQSLNFIGKAVSGDASKVSRMKGDKYHEFSFVLPEAAQAATIQVKNENGEVVRKVELRDLKNGENSWMWNGQDERGHAQPVGSYRFAIEAHNQFGKKMDVKTDFEGVITGVNYSAEGPVLLIGNQSIKLKDVKQIIDPAMLAQKNKTSTQVGSNFDQKLTNATTVPLKNEGDIGQNKETQTEVAGAPEREEQPQGNVMGLPMSREFQAKLEKETKQR